MASPANPNLWPILSGLGLSEPRNPDARATLLKVNAEMFVAAPARDRESIETFETLALGFLPRADQPTLRDVAQILAPCEDTPPSVLDYLVRRSPETRDIVLRHAGRLSYPLNARLLATPEGRLRLAARPDLDAETIRQLLVLREEAVEDALAASLDPASAAPCLEEFIRRAQARPALAATLLERGDLRAGDEAALYLSADRARRGHIRERVAASPAAEKSGRTFKPTVNDVSALLAASRRGDVGQLEMLLSTALAFPATTEWRVLQIGRHRLLALALKALGVPEREATQIFLTLHPALCGRLSAVTELVREMREVSGPVALALVEAILGAQASSERPRGEEEESQSSGARSRK